MDPRCVAIIISCTFSPSPAKATLRASPVQGVPVIEWPRPQEHQEQPHLPHEDRGLRVTVASGASGTNTSSQSTHMVGHTHLAWLRNEVSDTLLTVSLHDQRTETLPWGATTGTEINVEPQPKRRLDVTRQVDRRSRRG